MNIEDVQSQFDELMPWDKAKFIKQNLKYANPDDVLEFCSIDDEFADKLDVWENRIIPTDEETLDAIDFDVILQYIKEHHKE